MQLANQSRVAVLRALGDLADNGKLFIYGQGMAEASVDAPAPGPILAELPLSGDAFAEPVATLSDEAVMLANPIGPELSADAGIATTWRLYKADGVTALAQGTVSGTGGTGELKLATTALVAGDRVEITQFALRAVRG